MFMWHSSEWSMKIGKVREPTLLEYFATTALDTLAQTVIREAIQNSLVPHRARANPKLRIPQRR